MPALIEAINVKRKMLFEHENVPYACLDADVSTPTARGGQTLVRLKMRNLLTNAVFDKTFKAGDKFREPDLVTVPATFLYRDGDGFHFLDQVTFETLTLSEQQTGDAADFLIDGLLLEIHRYNGNPIGLDLPTHVDLEIAYTEPAVRGDTSSGATKIARLETGARDQGAAFSDAGREGARFDREQGFCRAGVVNRSQPHC